jgi:very-short-patch-repair endonuclease
MHQRWRAVFAVAEAHDGLVTLQQMCRDGLTDRMIDGARDDGMITRVAPSVYRISGAPQTERMAIAAAVLSAGGRASHGAAGSLLRLEAPARSVPIDVRVAAAAGEGRPTVRRVEVESASRGFHPVALHRCPTYGEAEFAVDGIRCTDAARALIDLAGRLRQDQLEDAFERARRLGLVSADSLARRFELVGGRGRRGAAKVREVLAHARPNPLDSKLEGRVWRMIRSSRLAEPVRQLRVDLPNRRWYRIDFAWPALLLAVEAEGFEWYGSRARWKADRIRVAALERLGWRVLVVTWDDVTERRLETVDRIALVLAERARLVRSA